MNKMLTKGYFTLSLWVTVWTTFLGSFVCRCTVMKETIFYNESAITEFKTDHNYFLGKAESSELDNFPSNSLHPKLSPRSVDDALSVTTQDRTTTQEDGYGYLEKEEKQPHVVLNDRVLSADHSNAPRLLADKEDNSKDDKLVSERRAVDKNGCMSLGRGGDEEVIHQRRVRNRARGVHFLKKHLSHRKYKNLMTESDKGRAIDVIDVSGQGFCHQMDLESENDINNLASGLGKSTFHEIIIENRTQCNAFVNMTTPNIFSMNVTVKTCCITYCTFNLQINVDADKHMLLHFPRFNVPGLNLLKSDGVGNCKEALHIVERCPSEIIPQGHANENIIGSFCGIKSPSTVFVEHSTASLELRLFTNDQCVDQIDFQVDVFPCLKFPHDKCLSDKYVRKYNDHGFISSPGLVEGQNYPNDAACNYELSVQEGMLLKLTPETFSLSPGDVMLIQPQNTAGRLFPPVLTKWLYEFHQPIVFPGHKAVINFSSDHMQSGIGFNISYKAVHPTAFIPMYNNGSLDCSGGKEIPESIRCDHYLDCIGGEDETDCDYRRDGCWPEGVYFDRFCYRVFPNNTPISWEQAEEKCEKLYSANILTITTPRKRKFVENLNLYYGSALSKMFLGLRRMRLQQVKQIYRRLWQWSDGTTAFHLPDEYRYEGWSTCSMLHDDSFYSIDCSDMKENVSYVCETEMIKLEPNSICGETHRGFRGQPLPQIDIFSCSSGEVISEDRLCNRIEDCYDGSDETDNCNYDSQGMKMFWCSTNALIPYSSVCDGIEDCPDASDESFCRHPEKSMLGSEMFMCTNGMVLNKSLLCDAREDCLDASDEEDCTSCGVDRVMCPMIACLPSSWKNDGEIDCPIRDLRGKRAPEPNFRENVFEATPPPGVVWPDGFGKVRIEPIRWSKPCPATHQQCVEGYCIPIYLWCNGVRDCPYGDDEDEEMCSRPCQGLYKCKHSSVCVHSQHVCDGHYQCPNLDDEILCDNLMMDSPENCTRKLMDYNCTSVPSFGTFTQMRSLLLTGQGIEDIRLENIAKYSLIFLNISHNKIHSLSSDGLDFLDLIALDVSNNLVTTVNHTTFRNCPVLEKLILAYNKIQNLSLSYFCNMKKLKKLDLSGNPTRKFVSASPSCVQGNSNLRYLFLRNMGLHVLEGSDFRTLIRLKHLDLEGNPITSFSPDIFVFQVSLSYLNTDNFRLCCSAIKPKSLHESKCIAPFDEISSCEDILRSSFLRAALWVMAILTILGNKGVILYRIFFDSCVKYSFRIIITCLSASDLLMGVYLIIIGSADAVYRDRYLVVEKEWKESVACQVAGFLCVLSSETSAMFILLVTLDRFTAIAFPLRMHLHFTKKSATIACAIVWFSGVTIATVPLLPPWNQWNFYSQKSVGVPLPITRFYFPGFDYAFTIFIVFNMAIFILVVLGQIGIYLSVHFQKVPRISELRLYQDTAIAKRLVLVVLTDCLCWFPICVMGLAACADLPVPGEMYVVASVILLPANSAFNPFLYTANAILVARKTRQKKRKDKVAIALRPIEKE